MTSRCRKCRWRIFCTWWMFRQARSTNSARNTAGCKFSKTRARSWAAQSASARPDLGGQFPAPARGSGGQLPEAIPGQTRPVVVAGLRRGGVEATNPGDRIQSALADGGAVLGLWPFELLLLPRRHVLRLPELTISGKGRLPQGGGRDRQRRFSRGSGAEARGRWTWQTLPRPAQ